MAEGDAALDERLSDELDAVTFLRRVGATSGRLPSRSRTTPATSSPVSVVDVGNVRRHGVDLVREDGRGQGFGGRMLAAAEAIAREGGCGRMNVSAFTFQPPDFYRRHGYRETGRTEALPVVGQADVHFVKVLA